MTINHLEHRHHVVRAEKHPLCYLAHNMNIPMNIGSLFRTADAFAVENIYLTGSSIVPPNRKIKHTSRSTEKDVAYAYEKSHLDLIEKLKRDGYTIISLELTSSSMDIRQLALSYDTKVCLILGSEKSGVSQELLDVSDQIVHIPMLGHNSSMNVATACAITTFEIIKRFMP